METKRTTLSWDNETIKDRIAALRGAIMIIKNSDAPIPHLYSEHVVILDEMIDDLYTMSQDNFINGRELAPPADQQEDA
jgi:hypothetical protein